MNDDDCDDNVDVKDDDHNDDGNDNKNDYSKTDVDDACDVNEAEAVIIIH